MFLPPRPDPATFHDTDRRFNEIMGFMYQSTERYKTAYAQIPGGGFTAPQKPFIAVYFYWDSGNLSATLQFAFYCSLQ